jgi:hypothetical protein
MFISVRQHKNWIKLGKSEGFRHKITIFESVLVRKLRPPPPQPGKGWSLKNWTRFNFPVQESL